MGNDRAKHQRNSTEEVILFILAVVATCISLDLISALVLVCFALIPATSLGCITPSVTKQGQESVTINYRICRFLMGLLCVILSVVSWQRLNEANTSQCNRGSCKYVALARGCTLFMSTMLWLVYSVRTFMVAFGYSEYDQDSEEDQDSESTRYSHGKALTIQNDTAKVTNTEMTRNLIVLV
mmetsp:Transcript_3617/g.7914  ORF Transcript_3617/g.7914 Transcript_3617/m.7914 type:complete len:182 (-) Transcript_3617:229-774(-)